MCGSRVDNHVELGKFPQAEEAYRVGLALQQRLAAEFPAVPDYRVPAKATLPGIGVAATFWRPVLGVTVPALLAPGLVVDLRSSDYAAMWRPRACSTKSDDRTSTSTLGRIAIIAVSFAASDGNDLVSISPSRIAAVVRTPARK